jgi:hypothetical protein
VNGFRQPVTVTVRFASAAADGAGVVGAGCCVVGCWVVGAGCCVVVELDCAESVRPAIAIAPQAAAIVRDMLFCLLCLTISDAGMWKLCRIQATFANGRADCAQLIADEG